MVRLRPEMGGLVGLLVLACATPDPARGSGRTLKEYVAAVRSDDAARAYALLSPAAKRTTEWRDFRARWKRDRADLIEQAAALEARLGEGPPEVFSDVVARPFRVSLRREIEGGQPVWRLETPPTSPEIEGRDPEEAIAAFLASVARTESSVALKVFGRDQRERITREIEMRLLRLGGVPKLSILGTTAVAQFSSGLRMRLVLDEKGRWLVVGVDD